MAAATSGGIVLDALAKALDFDKPVQTNWAFLGMVDSIDEDGTINVISGYSYDEQTHTATPTLTGCIPFTKAKVGDVVFVYVLKGQAIALSPRGGQDGGATLPILPQDGGVPSGGSTGQVLAKASDADYETEWVAQSGGSITKAILYDNPAGSNATITLSESAANYKYMRIFYRTNDNFYTSADIFEPNGKVAFLQGGWFGGSGTSASPYSMNYKVARISISGSQMTVAGAGYGNVGSTGLGGGNQIYITRVEAWNDEAEAVEQPGAVVLYSNWSAQNTLPLTVNLSDSAANYKMLKVFFRNNDSNVASVDVWEPDGKAFIMQAGNATATPTMYYKAARATISGSTITQVASVEANQTLTTLTLENATYQFVRIVQVIGYKALADTNETIRDIVPSIPLSIENGGTGASTPTAAFDALSTPLIYIGEIATASAQRAAHTNGSIVITLTAPAGFKVAHVLSVASNGGVVPAYVANTVSELCGKTSVNATLWWANGMTYAVTCSFSVRYLCVRDGFLTTNGTSVV